MLHSDLIETAHKNGYDDALTGHVFSSGLCSRPAMPTACIEAYRFGFGQGISAKTAMRVHGFANAYEPFAQSGLPLTYYSEEESE